MWCGCKPTDKARVPAPQPFSTMDDDADTRFTSVPSDDAARDAGRRAQMRSAPVPNPCIGGGIPAPGRRGF
jgi:hypothetical protein